MSKQSRKTIRSVLKGLLLLILIAIFLLGVRMSYLPYLERQQEEQAIEEEVASFRKLKAVNTELPHNPEDSSDAAPSEYLPELWSSMVQYNEQLYLTGQENLTDAWSYQAKPFDLPQYGIEDDVIGLVSIPVIDVDMPIYLGASYSNLIKGCAVLTETSMPIGGNNTNCVIAAHRGWNDIPFVRDIEEVTFGDSIFVENLWETLEYRVKEIKIVHPWETHDIMIQNGEDLLTLVTCHPYRENTYRYLVICERYIDTPEAQYEWQLAEQETHPITVSDGIEFESSRTDILFITYAPSLLFALSVLLLAVFLLIVLLQAFRTVSKKKQKE